MPAKSDVSDFARLIAAEVGQGRLRVKSDVSDFARSIAAEVGQGRLRVKAGHPVTHGESGGYWIARFRGRWHMVSVRPLAWLILRAERNAPDLALPGHAHSPIRRAIGGMDDVHV